MYIYAQNKILSIVGFIISLFILGKYIEHQKF